MVECGDLRLAEAWNRSEPGNVPAGLEEQILHAFHLRLDEPTVEDHWDWDEVDNGEVVHRFAFRWASLDEAARVLWPAQAMWANAVGLSLRHPA